MQNDDIKNKDKKQEKEVKTEDSAKQNAGEESARLKVKISELENQVKRTLADYQNLEKRVAEERRSLILNSNKQLILRLLPVLDTLMLANKHLNDQGLTLSIQQFLETLQHEGVKPIGPTTHAKFDPKLMECVEVVEGEEGRVVSEVLTGYLLNDEVLRPAMVKVGKKNMNKDSNPIVNEPGTEELWNEKDLDKGEDMLKENN